MLFKENHWSQLLSILVFSCTLTICSSTSLLAKTVVLTDQLDEFNIAKYAEYLEDKTGKLTIDDILAIEDNPGKKYKNKFTLNKSKSLSFGFSESVYWLKINIKNIL